MPEAAITTYSKEAQQLYERGIAAARGGQRRIAAGLLTRAVQLDPRHEQAWLWLSGVLDAPGDVEFCLNAALKINPHNTQAQKGLTWIRQRRDGEDAAAPATPSRIQAIAVPGVDAVVADDADTPPSVWQVWRQSRRGQRIRQRLVLVGLVVLLLGTSALLWAAGNSTLPTLDALGPAVPATDSGGQQGVPSPPEISEAALLAYLSDVQTVRTALDTASATYREVTNSATGTAVQIATVRGYLEALRQAQERLNILEPPPLLMPFHEQYLEGITKEMAALNDLLEYYTNYNIAIANRASLQFQEASGHYDQAIIGWEAYALETTQLSASSAFNLR